jgi:hypothetical protein
MIENIVEKLIYILLGFILGCNYIGLLVIHYRCGIKKFCKDAIMFVKSNETNNNAKEA